MIYIDDDFKRKVVKEYERGGVTKEQLRRKYGIRGKSAILQWCRLFGTKDYGQKEVIIEQPPVIVDQSLQQALADAQLRIAYLEAVIELANEKHGLNLKKKSSGKQ
jgi:transposase